MVLQVLNYTFNAAAKTVTLTDYVTIGLENILAIKNVTTNQWIYKLTDTGAFGGTVATNVLTFTATNAGMANGDDLFIKYDDGVTVATKTTQTDGSQKTQIPAIAISKKSVEITTSGDTTIHTPAAGLRIRLFSFGYSASGSVDTGNIKVRWRFGAGAYKDQQFLTGNQGYAKSPGNGKFFYEGGVNEALIVNLDATATIAMNIDYDEV